jgi:hypothetical protein
MKKTERLIAVEDFISVKELSLDQFYDVRIGEYQITLQGKFDSDITKKLMPVVTFALTDYGYLVGELNIPIEGSEENVSVRIVLT